MARDCLSDGSASTRDEPNKLDNFHFCLQDECLARLTDISASYEDLVIHYECEDGHKGGKCLTELAGV